MNLCIIAYPTDCEKAFLANQSLCWIDFGMLDELCQFHACRLRVWEMMRVLCELKVYEAMNSADKVSRSKIGSQNTGKRCIRSYPLPDGYPVCSSIWKEASTMWQKNSICHNTSSLITISRSMVLHMIKASP